MAQDPKHYSLRMTDNLTEALAAATKRYGDSANNTLNVAAQLGLTALLNKWDAVKIRHATTRCVTELTYNGNARKFKRGLTPPTAKR
jgi:hypothetical protein